MNKRTETLLFYLMVTLANMLVYAMPIIFNKEIGKPFLWVILALFPSLVACIIYEHYSKRDTV